MKKIVRSLLLMVVAITTAHAQPILTATNMNPVAGDGFYGHIVDTNVTMGASGAHITWNFAAVSQIGLDSTVVYACDSTPYCSLFPGSNIAEYNLGDYTYFNTSGTRLTNMGFYTSGTAYVNDLKLDMLRYPLSYNNVFVDTMHFGSASYDDFYTEIDSVTYDGYGTLILPSGTDTGVVRLRDVFYYKDSSSAGVVMGRAESYYWYMPGFHNPILTIDYDTTGSATGALYVTGATYYTTKANSTGITELTSLVPSLSVYPNPVSNELHIVFNSPNTSSVVISLTDVLGRTVATAYQGIACSGTNDIKYAVNDLPSGLYLVHVHSDAGNIAQKVSISR